MTTYKCGHTREVVLMNNDILGMATYMTWKDSVGWNGDKTECWECYCERTRNEELLRRL